jgi:hypothetical protein
MGAKLFSFSFAAVWSFLLQDEGDKECEGVKVVVVVDAT